MSFQTGVSRTTSGVGVLILKKSFPKRIFSNSVKEDRELIEAGFEYVTERNGVKIYRKPK